MSFKENLKEIRMEKELTQGKLAKLIGYAQGNVSRWESGEQEPTATAIIALANALDVSTDYLLGQEDEYGVKQYDALVQDYLTQINNVLSKTNRMKLESYAEGLLASENNEKLDELKSKQNKK